MAGMDERIKKLLASGRLTGKEAGRLVVQDSWLVDRNQQGFLSERDIKALKAGLRTQKDIEDYNSYIHAYRLIDFTLKEAHILALELQRDLMIAIRLVEEYRLEDTIRRIQLTLPAIVTQKQYDEFSSKQRANRLREITTLKEVLGKLTRIGRKGPKRVFEINSFLESFDKKARERLKAFLGILTMIEAVSDVMGIDFAEDMRDWHEVSRLAIDWYNEKVKNAPAYAYLGMPKLGPINVDRLRPSKSTAQYIRERLALSLGEGWEDAREAVIRELEQKEAEDAQEETA